MYGSAVTGYPYPEPEWPELRCLSGRKWWVFILSSVFTCLACISAVLICRVAVLAWNFIRFRNKPESVPDDPTRLNELEQRVNRHDRQDKDKGILSEGKNWALELLSGRTTTGKILVSQVVRSVHIHGYFIVLGGTCNRAGNVDFRFLCF